ncbi:AAA family ATPase [Paenibacillus sp. LHD-117]|uniref:AAA family ATPase n=1 Tax=Paenibacillus sp. LHD-117 TaxID=3071412 RepID=UPI0027E01D86|nr:AAA family ATPase [Paenibacillus sp. LHD-117]MDQ6422920.1 AAA family ATPase [Paenibacillus sp. LHD-117]
MRNNTVMAINKEVPFICRVSDATGRTSAGAHVYFDYADIMSKVQFFLKERFGCELKLYYQDENNDVWDALDEDLRSGYDGVRHAASLYDLVETAQFRYETERDRGMSGYEIRPSARNNLFIYDANRVAFARVPRETQYGLGHEDIIFAEDDEALGAFLADTRARQLDNRKLILFSDTKDGLEQERLRPRESVTRDDVFMEEALKSQIYRSVDEFFANEGAFFRDYGIPYKRGILLYGKPGNGKTTLVKSISQTAGAPVAYWQITEFTSSESISEVFAAAMRMAPMVLVIEDIDSMPESCRSYFLNTLDGAASKEGVFLIGTTNYPEKIDPALMNRAGRFDRAYEVKLPDEALRHAYLIRKGMGRIVGEDQLAEVARRTEGFTFAQLGELFVSAALQRHYEGEADLGRLIGEMKSDYAKGRSGDWMAADKGRAMGFL